MLKLLTFTYFPIVLSPRSSRLHKEGSLESIKEFAVL